MRRATPVQPPQLRTLGNMLPTTGGKRYFWITSPAASRICTLRTSGGCNHFGLLDSFFKRLILEGGGPDEAEQAHRALRTDIPGRMTRSQQ